MTSSPDRSSSECPPEETERLLQRLREAEARTAALEAHYLSILGSVDDVVYTLDQDLRYSGFYGRGVARRGINVEALLGKRIRDFGDDQSVEDHARAQERALRGETVVLEGPPAARAQTGRWVRDTLSPLYDASGAIVGVVGLSREITAERAAAQARQDLLVAEARLEGVNLAAREMAHLINNDLTAAVATFELLANDPTLPEDRRSLVQYALQGLLHASQHVRQFQNVVRVKTKPLSGVEALDLAQSAEEAQE
jgi:PAS domain S-box-containing protein